jgi:hypothetical protein
MPLLAYHYKVVYFSINGSVDYDALINNAQIRQSLKNLP